MPWGSRGGRAYRGGVFALLACLMLGAEARAASRLLVLSPDDEAAYRAAFEAIERGDWGAAKGAVAAAQDRSLAGAVLARLYLDPAYPADSAELVAWLREHPDTALAASVRERASRLQRRGDPAIPPVVRPPVRRYPHATPAAPGAGPADRDALEAALQALAANDLAAARTGATAALAGPLSGRAAFILGLVELAERRPREAGRLFAQAADWPHADAWARSGAHFFAARARIAAGEAGAALSHLRAAAQANHTLYGQLAEAQLGRRSGLQFDRAEPDPADLAGFLQRHPAAMRAAGLAQLGRLSDAELELERLHARLSPSEDVLFLALAEALAAPRAQLRAAEYGGPEVAAGHCPAVAFRPEDGFSLDYAALSAVMRQESRFTPVAVSRSNAQGLMQLLPSTAEDLQPGAGFRRSPGQLHEPSLNMTLGQDYLEWLLERPSVNGDLLRLAAAYNGGVGWLGRWIDGFALAADPQITLEALPRPETRLYAERVLAFFGLCRSKAGVPAPELDALASGRPPRVPRARGAQLNPIRPVIDIGEHGRRGDRAGQGCRQIGARERRRPAHPRERPRRPHARARGEEPETPIGGRADHEGGCAQPAEGAGDGAPADAGAIHPNDAHRARPGRGEGVRQARAQIPAVLRHPWRALRCGPDPGESSATIGFGRDEQQRAPARIGRHAQRERLQEAIDPPCGGHADVAGEAGLAQAHPGRLGHHQQKRTGAGAGQSISRPVNHKDARSAPAPRRGKTAPPARDCARPAAASRRGDICPRW